MTGQLSRKGLFHLFVVYILWSTTYLAARVGVNPSSGFPPFILGGLRMAVAGTLLLAVARLRGCRVRTTWREFLSLAVAGNLMWCTGNGLLLWAVQYANAGFACLMNSSTPIWVTIIELFLYRKRPPARLVIWLLVGLAGVAVLSTPSFAKSSTTSFAAVIALVISPISWALGSVFQARRRSGLDSQVMGGYHHIGAFFGYLVIVLALGKGVAHPALPAWIGWAYLVVFGSLWASTSFVLTLRLLPISIAMTYTYVNPVLTLVLARLLLHEPITAPNLAGAALVIFSVFAIFRIRQETVEASRVSPASPVPADGT